LSKKKRKGENAGKDREFKKPEMVIKNTHNYSFP
jgi:hypothetical protein